jgi:hypothetical protein
METGYFGRRPRIREQLRNGRASLKAFGLIQI